MIYWILLFYLTYRILCSWSLCIITTLYILSLRNQSLYLWQVGLPSLVPYKNWSNCSFLLGTSPCEKSVSCLWFLFTIYPASLYFNCKILHPLLSPKIFFHNLSSLRIWTSMSWSQILLIFFHQSIQLIFFLLYFLTLYIFLNLFF